MQANHYYRSFRSDSGRTSQGIIPAVTIMAIGALLLLSNLHIVYVDNWWKYWPVLLIGGGLAKLVDSSEHGGRVMGGIFIGVGGLFLLNNLGLILLTWDAFWPMVLIGIGVLMLVNRLSGPLINVPVKATIPPAPDGVYTANAIFSGFKRKFQDTNFEGAHLVAIFGGGELNLRQARMEGDSAEVYATAIFGGIEIKVPENWQVISDGTGIFGGFADQTERPRSDTPGLKKLYVKGEAVFGGVEVKN
ncbi:MAG TPA: DUF5668 domain-containing protein [Candidatus Solibacter sp.]|nr:DUF5668 domain-containing protein [Candidatus Solibacter sp.]